MNQVEVSDTNREAKTRRLFRTGVAIALLGVAGAFGSIASTIHNHPPVDRGGEPSSEPSMGLIRAGATKEQTELLVGGFTLIFGGSTMALIASRRLERPEPQTQPATEVTAGE